MGRPRRARSATASSPRPCATSSASTSARTSSHGSPPPRRGPDASTSVGPETPPAARSRGGITLQAMPDPGDVRVSDHERERDARQVRAHYHRGRLDEDELNERFEAAYAARTQSELNALRADLPALP